LATVREVIGDVGAREIPEIVAFNKADLIDDSQRLVLVGPWNVVGDPAVLASVPGQVALLGMTACYGIGLAYLRRVAVASGSVGRRVQCPWSSVPRIDAKVEGLSNRGRQA
ncbi:hypothetical protein IAE22_33105, partial [Bacillus sp. S34]|nr:hypothetical protein [Bacillus sp. S34]